MTKTFLVVGGALPVVSFAAALAGVLTFDQAISTISTLFVVALVPGIVENYRRKIGWAKHSTVMTASGLIPMGTMFLILGLTFTGVATLASGTMWVILTFQSFLYGKAP